MATIREVLEGILGSDGAQRTLNTLIDNGVAFDNVDAAHQFQMGQALSDSPLLRRLAVAEARSDWWSSVEIPSKYRRLLDAQSDPAELEAERVGASAKAVEFGRMFLQDAVKTVPSAVLDSVIRRSWERWMSLYVDVVFLTGGAGAKSLPLSLPVSVEECLKVYDELQRTFGNDAEPTKALRLLLALVTVRSTDE